MSLHFGTRGCHCQVLHHFPHSFPYPLAFFSAPLASSSDPCQFPSYFSDILSQLLEPQGEEATGPTSGILQALGLLCSLPYKQFSLFSHFLKEPASPTHVSKFISHLHWVKPKQNVLIGEFRKKKLPPLSNVNMDCLTCNKANRKTDRKICSPIDAGCGLTRDFLMGRAMSEISFVRA